MHSNPPNQLKKFRDENMRNENSDKLFFKGINVQINMTTSTNFQFLLQQPKSASNDRRYPIFVALERGLNVSMKANIQPAVIESQI